MDEFKALIFEFLSMYDKPKIVIEYLGLENYAEKGPLWKADEGSLYQDDPFNRDFFAENESVKVNVNGYSDPVKYFEKLSIFKHDIINKLWTINSMNQKSVFQSTAVFTMGLFRSSLMNFEKRESDIFFSTIPLGSPKGLVIQGELIFNKKEEKKYIAEEKSCKNWRGTDERKKISTYYYFMIEILEELISFMENINTIKKEGIVAKSFILADSKQSLTDFKYSLTTKGLIDNIDMTPFKNIFLGGTPEHKINWIGGKELLKFFIDALVDKGYVKNVWQKWKTTSNCFLINGEEIIPLNIATQQKPQPISQDIIGNLLLNLKK
jgi:hypothetical protein